ncbi:MAG: VCBS repeat-containing protein [Octadecabacter sp.]|nr:VCBS repeat-containing protein [Octadecabacter sp.]
MAPRRPWHPGLRWARVVCCLWLADPVAAVAQTIVAAQFDGPTTGYAHGILGDAVEYTDLLIIAEDGAGRVTYRIRLPQDHVFEDLAPRLWDITGDGQPEVVVIETDMALGGALAVYDLSGKIAETPHIGRTNRWLAPVGAADLDGDGRIEVAFVDRPHLAKVMRVFEWDGTGLRLEAELAGLTNHRIGQDFITGGLRDCGSGPEMVTANADWTAIMVTRLTGGGLQTLRLAPFSAAAMADVLGC